MIKELITQIISVKNKQDLNYPELIKKSLKANFPVFSLWILVQSSIAKARKEESTNINTVNGWVNPSQEAKINELYQEISRLRKIKLIDFPNIDKKWMYLFVSTAIIATLIVVSLVATTRHYEQKSTQLGGNVEVLVSDTTNLAGKLRDSQIMNQSLEYKVFKMRDSINIFKMQMTSLGNDLSLKNITISDLEKEVAKSKRDFAQRNIEVDNLKKEVSTLKSNKAFLESTNANLKNQLERLNNINFKLGASASSLQNCRDRPTDSEHMYFNSFCRIKIRKITIVSRESGRLQIFAYDNNTKEVKRKFVNVNRGQQTIDLDFEISEGRNHYLSFSGVRLRALRECYRFPYSVPNMIEFTKGNTDLYPPFYDIIVSVNAPI